MMRNCSGDVADERFGFQWFGWLFGITFLVSSIAIGQYNFLLFHGIVEIAAVVVSCCIFTLAWNACLKMENSFLVFLGIAHLVIAIIQTLHALAYKGMGVFPGAGANLPTQLWVGARYVEAAALLAAPSLLKRRVPPLALVTLGFLVLAGVAGSIFAGVFPDCFVEPTGLTAFKKTSEYVICLVMVAALYRFWTHRERFSPRTFQFLAAYILATILAEVMFTFYISVFGISNFAGHLLKTIGVLFLFEATVASAIRQPFEVLYRELAESRKDLGIERDSLKKALAEVKALSGLLPICASCKKIRNDKGYWEQIETYVCEHSEARFSHGVCPECVDRLYPEYTQK
jgi:hypothetical protein